MRTTGLEVSKRLAKVWSEDAKRWWVDPGPEAYIATHRISPGLGSCGPPARDLHELLDKARLKGYGYIFFEPGERCDIHAGTYSSKWHGDGLTYEDALGNAVAEALEHAKGD